MKSDDMPETTGGAPETGSPRAGKVVGSFGVVAEASGGPPEPQARDAEGLTPALASLQAALRQEQPQTIDSAPRGRPDPLLLFCPAQGGWQEGHWRDACEPSCWVAALDGKTVLQPTHWGDLPVRPD